MSLKPVASIAAYNEGALQGSIQELDVVGASATLAVSGVRGTLTITPGQGVFAVSTHEEDFGATPTKDGHFYIGGQSGLVPGNGILIQQATGPYTGKGTDVDEATMDFILAIGRVFNDTTIEVFCHSDTFFSGNIKFDYAA